jgi:hypothetical protein
MTLDQQRIAIAQACGWTEIYWLSARGLISARGLSGRPPGKICSFKYLPDYINDLNAMHEAEKVLTYEQKEQFVFWMNHIHPSADIHHSDAPKDFRLEVFSLVHSPASQRREAFLRTLGLWQESPTQPK